ncbi:MAG: carboxypeptidase regulatory-like domain-containing protein [Vicinamibacterales bacterium]
MASRRRRHTARPFTRLSFGDDNVRSFVGLVLAMLIALAVPTLQGRAAAGVTFSGTVAGNDQGFLSGATVIVDGPQHKETKTDADGRFTITDVASGRYQLRVMADGYLPLEQPLTAGTAAISVDIVLLRLPGL